MDSIKSEDYEKYSFNNKYYDNTDPFSTVLRLVPASKGEVSIYDPIFNHRRLYRIAIYYFIKDIFLRESFKDIIDITESQFGIIIHKNHEYFKPGFYLSKTIEKETAAKFLKDVIKQNRMNGLVFRDVYSAGSYERKQFQVTYMSEKSFFFFMVKLKDEEKSYYLETILSANSRLLAAELDSIDEKIKNSKYFEYNFSQSIAKQIDEICHIQKEKRGLNSKFVFIVENFLKKGMAGETSLISLVQKTYKKIWKEIQQQYKEIDIEIFEDMNSFLFDYEKSLFQIKYYRDHSIHMFVIFVLGLIVINKIGEESIIKIMKKAYNKTAKKTKNKDQFSKLGQFTTMNEVVLNWAITSLLHDISLPLEKANKIIESMLKNQLFTEEELSIIESDDIFKVGHNTACPLFSPSTTNSFRILCHYLSSLYMKQVFEWEKEHINYRHECPFRYRLGQHIWKNFDHGILGAIRIISKLFIKKENREFLFKIMPSISAIAAHNCLFKDPFDNNLIDASSKLTLDEYIQNKLEQSIKKTIYCDEYTSILDFIDLEIHPLAFLLIYCDTAHEWGRGDYIINELPDLDIQVNFKNKDEEDEIMFNLTFPIYKNKNWETWKKEEFNEVYSILISKKINFGIDMPGAPYDTSVLNRIKDEKDKKRYKNYKKKLREFRKLIYER